MKSVDAVWEKRNLGVSTAEIQVEAGDTVQEALDALESACAGYSYIVVRVPSVRTDVTWKMAGLGFCFVEDMMSFEHDLHEIQRTPLQQRLYDAVRISPMEGADFDILYEEIGRGSFSFDRVSNDPFFSRELGARRFQNWLSDERERGAQFLKGTIKGEMTGFFTLREVGQGVYTSALGGTFMKWRRGGLGTNVQTPEEVRKRGGKKLVLAVSTNNMVQIRALVANGFFPKSVDHVFVKHTDTK